LASYYYLISSLPTLKAEADAPIDYDGFLALCKTVVSEKVYSFLKDLSVLSDKGPLIKEWSDFYLKLNDEMIYQRKLALGKPCKVPDNRDVDAIKTVSAALNSQNPLEAEQMLLSLEFKRLDELSGMHYFDDYVLNGYAMKLKLLERKQCFKFEEGKAEFRMLFEGIQQQILNV